MPVIQAMDLKLGHYPLADKNRRTVNAEITIAIEAHVKPRKNGAKK